MKTKRLSKAALERLVLKLMDYNEYVCGNGFRRADLESAIRLGFREGQRAARKEGQP